MSPPDADGPAPETALIHHAWRSKEAFESSMPPTVRASTVWFPTMASVRALDREAFESAWYGLFGTPTTFALQARIADLEGGRHSLLVPSGMAAITLVDLALLKSGDGILLPSNAYVTSRELAVHELSSWGIGVEFYDAMDPASLTAAIGPRTRLVWLEAPGSVTMAFPDLPALLARARASGAVVALDNTWGCGLAFDAFAISAGESRAPGVDITVNALTKYACGHGDVVMGAVTTRDAGLHAVLRAASLRQGWGVGADDASLILRSLPSLPLRYAAHDRSARAIARWCSQQAPVRAVFHPALPGSPGHDAWRHLCRGAAGVFTFALDPRFGSQDADRFIDALRWFRIGFSWGGSTSLVMGYDAGAARFAGREASASYGPLVRLSVGLESTDDLLADLDQAMASLR